MRQGESFLTPGGWGGEVGRSTVWNGGGVVPKGLHAQPGIFACSESTSIVFAKYSDFTR